MQATKKNQVFAIYAIRLSTLEDNMNEKLHPQYYEFKDVFEKNANILPQHQLYDYTIKLQDGIQPPFALSLVPNFKCYNFLDTSCISFIN